ncbi:hypothetical protein RND71_043541 [Anisodus tanguticus]|uniref:J domain-containing protein n=1 Tax=Anisodus tanguticus TaxID=243964 RepID=A0AAE1QPL9_9SOLA|nr:hypothetical protein RND71_043541 [Anisodus tanguticus]
MPVDEEVESWHLKFLHSPPNNWSFNHAVLRFNSNCAYSGLLHSVTQDRLFAENKEKLIQIALGAFVEKEGDQDEISNEDLEQQFQGLRRLVASKAGFTAFTVCPRFRESLGRKVVKALKRNNEAVIHASIDVLCALMQPMHDDYDLRQEQLNKSSLLSSKDFLKSLLDVLQYHVNCGTGALIVASMLDFLTFALCAPYSETTDGMHFDTLLAMVASYGISLFKLFQHPSLAVVKGAGLVMKAIIEEADMETVKKMQNLAMDEGSFLKHLQIALFASNNDSRYLAFQQLSRQLVALWMVDNEVAKKLLERIFPLGLLNYLESEEKPPKNSMLRLVERNNLKLAEDLSSKQNSTFNQIREIHPSVRVIEKHLENVFQHWREKIGVPKHDLDSRMQQKPVLLRKRRERIKSTINWPMFFYQFYFDHSKPDLLWNYKTKEELRDALENEIKVLATNKELIAKNTDLAWNHTEFEVIYQSLNNEIKIGDYYLRLLLEEGENNYSSSLISKLCIKKPYEFFNDLYHKFLLSSNASIKASCIQAMSIIYGAYHEKIGQFNDVKWIISLLKNTIDKLERDRLVIFISKIISNPINVKQIIDANGIKVLVDLVTLAHLHVNRAFFQAQNNVIEASAEMVDKESSLHKEWFYTIGQGNDKKGPISFKEIKKLYNEGKIDNETKFWAQGLESWKYLKEIPQLKWSILATENAILNETELAIQILNILIKICEIYPSKNENGAIITPLPRIKKYLSESSCLPHIVQLLLTFDPTIVERVSCLLTEVMQDNPVLSRLYLTGAFFFILMYTGSNLLPIGQLLHFSHLKQAFKSEDKKKTNSLAKNSFLGNLLPESMICYLENYGSEKFAQIFLGEFDTPEAIWNGEMRRLMIEKIAAHIADFSPRLRSNTRAVYQYCPIPPIQYPQLENELFCNVFYLKNLCDSVRFPNWPIRYPVELLKDILEAWKNEVEKKPSNMSLNDALLILELNSSSIDSIEDNTIRKAYFKLAQKYHPDKNPEGREKFEEINHAYEYLCSRNQRCSKYREGPDPINISLILQAQSILFKQCTDHLQPYKYAGYPMLVSTLKLETKDDQLFSKQYPLLAYACETAYHTIKCSALNAEELRREGGLDILQEALNRCVNVLGKSSKPENVAVQVSIHIIRCFTGSATFSACRDRLVELPSICKDISRILYFDHLTKLCLCTVECISAFASDLQLQNQLFKSGAFYSLLMFLFKYDFTLEEGGVEANEESNKQEVANQLAKMSIIALTRLAGNLTSEEIQKRKDQNEISTQETNNTIKRCLNVLLTPYLARKLGTADIAIILKELNNNIEIPYLIWDNSTRVELNEYLTDQLKSRLKGTQQSEEALYNCNLVYSSHKDELVIGEIFVKIYNQQPMYPLFNAKEFTAALLDYIGSQAQYLHSAMVLSNQKNQDIIKPQAQISSERLKNMEMSLQALCNVIKYNSGVETVCIGSFKLLFSLLKLEQLTQLQLMAINVISSVSNNQECVADIAASEVLVYLLLVLQSPIYKKTKKNDTEDLIQFDQEDQQVTQKNKTDFIARQSAVLDTIIPLMANNKLVKEVLNIGGVIYLLDIFCQSTNSYVREKSAELLSKMSNDKLVGPKVRILFSKFLPNLFLDAMSDSPEAAINLFDGNQENPELIWNSNSRKNVCKAIRDLTVKLYNEQHNNPSTQFKLEDDFKILYNDSEDEITISGVYLRLFVQNPSWVLRRPKEFLTDLMENFQSILTKKDLNTEDFLKRKIMIVSK